MLKKLFFLYFLFIFLNQAFGSNLKTTLSGKVSDKLSGEPLAGVTVYVPDLKTGTVTDINGNYKIENLPESKILLHVSMVGFRTIIESIDLSVLNIKHFELEYVATELNEIVITGLSKATEQKRTPTPMSIIPRMELLQNTSTNIIDAISSQPGISGITTGAGIAKPVIRGLGYNRVVTLHNGVRQEGQQWGDEHGIEIDEYAVNKVEILKGPASLAYGSDAIAGVINLISDPSQPEGKISGTLITNYQTNNALFGNSANFSGNQKGFIWDLRFSNKFAHAYKNKFDGYVYNSGFRENSVSGLIGLNRSWGYSHIEMSAYSFTPGIIEGERDSISGKFIKITGETKNIVAENEYLSYTPDVPYQEIHHYKAVLNNNFIIGAGNFRTNFGFQQNRRQEYGENPDAYGLYFLLNTFSYDLSYNLPELKKFNISIGTNGMKQNSFNKGVEYLVPEYELFDFGVFGVVKKEMGKFDISAGIRYDRRTQNGKDLYLNSNNEKVEFPSAQDIHRFASFRSVFSGISGSMGATMQISKSLYTKVNISRGYRAPNIGELASNGIHEGTLRYETGDPNLKPEHSLQFDYTLGLSTEHIYAEVAAFYNTIDNFIFLRKLPNNTGGDSVVNNVSVFKFFSGNASLYGGEIRFDIHPHPLDWLHFENSFSYVQAKQSNQPDSARYLPFTPAPKIQSTVKADVKKINKRFGNFFIKLSIENYFNKNKYYAAYDTETSTPGYSLLHFGMGADVLNDKKTMCSIYFSIQNLTDNAYQSHLSRLKYTPVNYATARSGIYNMGRNVSFKLIVPLRIK